MHQPTDHEKSPTLFELRAKLTRAKDFRSFWIGIKIAALLIWFSFAVFKEMWFEVFTGMGLTFVGHITVAGIILALSCFGLIKSLKHTNRLEEEIEETTRILRGVKAFEAMKQSQ